MGIHDPQRKPKVLLIEDDMFFQELASAILEKYCVLIIARTLLEGYTLLEAHEDIDILILDGRVPLSERDRSMVTTVELAEHAMRTRAGHIMLYAASGDDDLNRALVQLGARPTNKTNAYTTVCKYLAEVQ